MNRFVWVALLLCSACGDGTGHDEHDGGPPASDAGGGDAATSAGDAATADGGTADAGRDAGPEDTTFSFVVIPDTQNEILSDRWAEDHFNDRVQWIVDNEASLDIRFALQTGDLVNWDTPDHDQYVRASDGLAGLDDAAIPYVLAIGNHDTAATCEGGSACPGDTHANLRDTTTFNEFFPVTRFPALGGVFEDDKLDNSYHLIRAGGLDWVIISLELWARTTAYEWVGEVLAMYPDHNGIVITHSHLDGHGGIFDSNGGYGDNSPRQIFDEVLSQHANLRFVFSGHQGLSGFRQDTGANGNEIYQFLYNRNDDTNPVRIVTVDTEANTIDTYVYGPATDEMLDTPGTTVSLTDVEWVR